MSHARARAKNYVGGDYSQNADDYGRGGRGEYGDYVASG